MIEFHIKLAESMVAANHTEATVKQLEDKLAMTLRNATLKIVDVPAMAFNIGFEKYRSLSGNFSPKSTLISISLKIVDISILWALQLKKHHILQLKEYRIHDMSELHQLKASLLNDCCAFVFLLVDIFL